MYALNEEQVIDPTNADGTVDLEITFLFGLIKVDTTIARINEPPTGGDVNVFTRVDASGVSVVAERNIFTGEEVFMDYGRVYDRSDYEREEQRAQEAEVRPSSRHCPLLCCHPFINPSIHPSIHPPSPRPTSSTASTKKCSSATCCCASKTPNSSWP